MSLQLRQYFFDTMLDRLKNGDIPTEETFRNLLDSIAVFRELSDTAQRAKGGLVKTTPDTKVNNRDGSDVLGQSPLGYKTFVQPQQIFRISGGANVTIVDVPRSMTGADDSGEYIIDKRIDVTIPPFPTVPTTTSDLVTSAGITLNSLTGAFPYAVTGGSIVGGTNLQSALVAIAAEVNNLVAKTNDIADIVYNEAAEKVGSYEPASTPPGTWDTLKYVEPKGQSLAVVAYPVLFAKIGYMHGGSGASFNVPNMTADAYLRAVLSPSALVGTMTGNNDFTITNANLPQHNHTFSGTTDPDGSHSHDISIATSLSGTIRVDGSAGAVSGTDTTSISTEPDHTHTFGPFTTSNSGSVTPTSIPLTPKAHNVYLKYRIAP